MDQNSKTEFLATLAANALTRATETPWEKVSLSDLCASADVALVECAKAHITKAHVTSYLDALVDQTMLAEHSKVDTSQSIRDRLFDVLMSRFDAMSDQRDAWVSILSAEKSDGLATLARRARRTISSAWALEAAGVSTTDLRGASRALALARILRLVESVWLNDGPDLAKTMARLDQELRAGEEWLGRIEELRGFFKGKSTVKPAAEPTL